VEYQGLLGGIYKALLQNIWLFYGIHICRAYTHAQAHAIMHFARENGIIRFSKEMRVMACAFEKYIPTQICSIARAWNLSHTHTLFLCIYMHTTHVSHTHSTLLTKTRRHTQTHTQAHTDTHKHAKTHTDTHRHT